MATAAKKTVIKTKKLVYANGTSVKQSDKVHHPHHGQCTVENIRAPRRKHSSGRVAVKGPDGKIYEFHPGAVGTGFK